MTEERRVPMWGPRPQPGKHLRRLRDIISVPGGGAKITLQIVGKALYGVDYHHLAGASRFCTGARGPCPDCAAGHLPDWQGWLAVQKAAGDPVNFVSLTPNAVRTCTRLLIPRPELRGHEIVLWRMGSGPRGAMVAALQERHTPVPWLQPEPPITAWVEKLFKLPVGSLARYEVDRDPEFGDMQFTRAPTDKGGQA